MAREFCTALSTSRHTSDAVGQVLVPRITYFAGRPGNSIGLASSPDRGDLRAVLSVRNPVCAVHPRTPRRGVRRGVGTPGRRDCRV